MMSVWALVRRSSVQIPLLLIFVGAWAAALYEQPLVLSTGHLESWAVVARHFAGLFNLLLIALHGWLLIASGLWPVRSILERRILPERYTLPLVLVFSALVGYGVFWFYFVHHLAGLVISLVVFAISVRETLIWTRAFQRNEEWIGGLTHVNVFQPLLYMFWIATAYHCSLTAFQSNPPNYVTFGTFRLLHGLPIDNELPLMFTNKLWHGEDPRKLFLEWISSDRPPLQVGMVLVHRWIDLLPGNGFDRQYQVVSTLLQCMWVPTVWLLCRELCLSLRLSRWVLLACATSGFFFLNSIFVWPKLLAGSLLLIAVLFMLPALTRKKALSFPRATAAATAAILGFLSHGGAAFSIAALMLLGLPLFFRAWRVLIPAAGIAFLLYLPWMLYQKLYDPPGTRLMKWHLAGVTDVNNPRSVLRTIRDEYGKLTPALWLEGKTKSLWEWVRPPDEYTCKSIRINQFFAAIPALGILNVGGVLGILYFVHRKLAGSVRPRAATRFQWLLAIALVGQFIWLVLIFEPGSTVNHVNSYATLTILFLLFAVECAKRPPWLRTLILTLHIASFAVLWLFTTPERVPTGGLNLSMALAAVLLWIGLVASCLRSAPKRQFYVSAN